jgi:hypothetical protein
VVFNSPTCRGRLLAGRPRSHPVRHPWIATVGIRDGGQSGSRLYLYLKSGLVITAAHLTAVDANMCARIAGVALTAKILKQSSLEDVDLSLLLVDQQKLPPRMKLPRIGVHPLGWTDVTWGATIWAQEALAAKNRLAATDAKHVEDAFEQKLSELAPSVTAKVADDVAPRPGGSCSSR